MTSQTIVKMEGISKAFAGIKALDNVQIDLRQGEIHALMGENGAGKSTLMKIMTGVYTRDSGKMYLQNQSSNQLEEVEIKSPLVGQKLGLSMVFQEFNLLENMNIAENIFIGREPLGVGQTVDKKQLLQNAVEELKKVNLDIDPNTEVSKLSCGQKQCVEIAKALSFNARVVVFDEPTASLSEKESQTFFKIIYVFLTIFLYLLKCPQSLILSALRVFCFCGKPHISRLIFLYFLYQTWLKSW